MANSIRQEGYKRKPLWVYGAAIFLMIVPVANFLMFMIHQNEARWYAPDVWVIYAQLISPLTWGFIFLTLFSGALLLFVRQVTWILALATLTVLVAYNLFLFKQFAVLAILLLCMILLAPFRRPYLQAKSRWWEQSPRYTANTYATLLPNGTRVKVHNISLSGMLVEWIDAATPVPPANLQITLSLGSSLEILCDITRRHENMLGIRFKNLPVSVRQKLKQKIKDLTLSEKAIKKEEARKKAAESLKPLS